MMAILLKTTKILWGCSGNRCAICRTLLVEDAVSAIDDDSVVGDMAHIVAQKPTFTRGDYAAISEAERDHYSNLILLCRKHHKVIDDQPSKYTVEHLRDLKTAHEEWVRNSLEGEDSEKSHDDLLYATIVDEWANRIDLQHWTGRGTFIYSADGPEIDKEYYKSLSEVPQWIISRVWPHRYDLLETRSLISRLYWVISS